MKREIIPQSKGKTCVTILIPLGTKNSERALKLDDEVLQKQLNELAKNACCEYAVRLNGDTATAEIAFTHQGIITDQDEYDYEIKAINFMSEVDRLDLPKHEPECPSHEDEETNVPSGFMEELLRRLNLDEDDPDRIRGAELMCVGFPFFCGSVSPEALKEMCELYLKAHEQD